MQNLHPAYFAMVMATGIISLAAFSLDFPWTAWGLFGINIVGYWVLWALVAARALLYPRAVLADLDNHARGVGYISR